MIRRLLAALSAATLVLMAAAAPAHAKSAQPDVLWYNAATGEVTVWEMNGDGDVLNAQPLSWRCGPADGCASAWRPVGGLTWYNAATGALSTWDVDTNTGQVRGEQTLSWRCDTASGCASAWTVAAQLDVDGDWVTDVLWHNVATGELSAWLLDGEGHVTGTRTLSWPCAAACAAEWAVVGAADFDSDGHDDLLWHNPASGELSVWRLAGGTVTGTMSLSKRCGSIGTRVGCSRFSRVIGTADFNHDGIADVLWHNWLTGEVSAWHLDGHATVTSTKTFNWKCDEAHGCGGDWSPIGVGNFAD